MAADRTVRDLPSHGRSDTVRGLRSLLTDALVYGVAVAAIPAAAFLATPVLTRVLGPSGYGTVDVLASLLALATVIALAGLDQAVTRGYYDHGSDEPDERSTVVRAGLTTALATSAGLAALVGGTAALVHVARGGRFDTEIAGAAAAALLVLPLATAQSVARLPLLLERRRWTYVGVGVLQAGLGMGVAVALVAAGFGPAGFFLGLTVGAACALGATLTRTRLLADGLAFDKTRVVALLRYGIPLVPVTVMIWAVFAVDRSLIVGFRGLEEAGYYGVASRVTAPLLLAVSAFGVAWSPLIMSQPRSLQHELRARTLTAVVAVTGAIFLVLFLFAEPLVRLLGGHDYLPAVRAVPGLGLGWLGWAVATVLLTEFAVTKRTSAIALVTGISAGANVLLNLILIPPFGFRGAAWATAGSFWLMALAAWAWERRVTSTPYRWGRLATLAVVVGAIVPAAELSSSPTGSVIKALLSLIGIAALLSIAARDRARAPLGSAGPARQLD